VVEIGLRFALQFGNDPLCQHFAQFDTPLVERVDLPDRAWGEDRVLVKGDEFASVAAVSAGRPVTGIRDLVLAVGCMC
jgi:hypothetical protein